MTAGEQTSAARELTGERGIYEELSHPPGLRVLKFIGRNGEWLMQVTCRRDLFNDVHEPGSADPA